MLFSQVIKREAEDVHSRCSPLATLSSFPFSVLLSNEQFESGNKSWAVYGSAIISGNVHLFILTGTIPREGVYCRFLFPRCRQMPLLSVMLCRSQDFMAWIFAYPILEVIENLLQISLWRPVGCFLWRRKLR